MTATISPLLRGQGLPEYSAITPEMVSSDIPALLEALNDEFNALELRLEQAMSSDAPLPWDTVMLPMQRISERLRWSWGVVSHLNGVCNSKELREAHAAQQPEVVRLGKPTRPESGPASGAESASRATSAAPQRDTPTDPLG